MVLYNVTVSIEKTVEQEWLTWMINDHVPKVLATGCFLENRLLKMQNEEPGNDATYASQYLCKSQASYDEYLANFAQEMQKHHNDAYEGKFAAFRTILDVIEIIKP